nr:hypothetical protein [Bacteroidota bacterium]
MNLGENGKQWPVLPDGSDTEILHLDTFKRGKGKFEKATWKESKELADNKKIFLIFLPPIASLEHYNCGTMTRRTGNALIFKEDVLIINPEDAVNHLIEMVIWFALQVHAEKLM